MAKADVLTLEMRAKDRASGQMRRAAKEMFSLKKAATQLAGSFAVLGAARQFVTFLNDAGAAARTFETGMARVNTLLGDQPDLLARLGDDVGKLSAAYGTAAGDIQNAMFQAISAGVDAAKATEFLEVAAGAAVGGFTSMETAVDGLTNVINAYGLEVSAAAKISDDIFIANKLGKTTFEEIAGRIGDVAPIAAQLGIRFEELTAFIVATTKQGMSTRKVITGLRQALAGVMKPAADTAEAAQELGIQFNAANLGARGLVKFLQDIAETTGGDVEALGRLIPSVEALAVVAAATSSVGLKDMNEALAASAKGMGAADEAARKVADTAEGRLKRAEGALADEVRKVGDATKTQSAAWAEVKLAMLQGVRGLAEYAEKSDAASRKTRALHASIGVLSEHERNALRDTQRLADAFDATFLKTGGDATRAARMFRQELRDMRDEIKAGTAAELRGLADSIRAAGDAATAAVGPLSRFDISPPGEITIAEKAAAAAKSMGEYNKVLKERRRIKAEKTARDHAAALREEAAALREQLGAISAVQDRERSALADRQKLAAQMLEAGPPTLGVQEAIENELGGMPKSAGVPISFDERQAALEKIRSIMGDSEADADRAAKAQEDASKAMMSNITATGQTAASSIQGVFAAMESGNASAFQSFMALSSGVLGGVATWVPALAPFLAGLDVIQSIFGSLFGSSRRRRRSAPSTDPGGTFRASAPVAAAGGPNQTTTVINFTGRTIHTKEEIAREVGDVLRSGRQAGTMRPAGAFRR